MSKWTEKPISSLGRIVTGKTPSKAEPEYWDGDELFVSPKDMERDSFYIRTTQANITKKALTKFKSQRLPKNSVMYTSLSYGFGKIGVATKDLLTNQQITSVISNKDNDFRFIYYLLRVSTPHIFSYNSGIDTPIVPKSVFEKIQLPIPPLPIQRKIAAILSAYDELIENNNRRIAILEKMAEEIYREWFVRLRFPGHEKVKVVKGVPEGWEVKKVKDIVDRKPFGKIYRESDLSEDGKIIVIDQSTKDYLGFYDGEPEHMASIDEPIILFGDHSCKMLLMIKPFSLAENVVPFKSRHKIPIVYLYYMVHNLIETTEYKRHWTELTNKSVFVPTKHLQESFSEFAKPLLLKKDKLVASTNALKKSRDLLLPRLISGKLDVEHLDIAFPPGMEEERS